MGKRLGEALERNRQAAEALDEAIRASISAAQNDDEADHARRNQNRLRVIAGGRDRGPAAE